MTSLSTARYPLLYSPPADWVRAGSWWLGLLLLLANLVAAPAIGGPVEAQWAGWSKLEQALLRDTCTALKSRIAQDNHADESPPWPALTSVAPFSPAGVHRLPLRYANPDLYPRQRSERAALIPRAPPQTVLIASNVR